MRMLHAAICSPHHVGGQTHAPFVSFRRGTKSSLPNISIRFVILILIHFLHQTLIEIKYKTRRLNC